MMKCTKSIFRWIYALVSWLTEAAQSRTTRVNYPSGDTIRDIKVSHSIIAHQRTFPNAIQSIRERARCIKVLSVLYTLLSGIEVV
eukprot:9486241-Pyramimonas_sp.AAC.4